VWKIEEVRRVEEDKLTQGDTRHTLEVEPLRLHVSQYASVNAMAIFVDLRA